MFTWNGKVYFEWPDRGTIYEVDERAIGLFNVVELPEGTELSSFWHKDGWLEINEIEARNRNSAPVYKAKKVFDFEKAHDFVFEGDWEPLLWVINAAAAVNTLLSVSLTQEEYERLTADDGKAFEELKTKMSPCAVKLIHLFPASVWIENDCPVLELYRYGSCS